MQGADGSVPAIGANPGEAQNPVGVADGGAEQGGGGRRHSVAGLLVGLCAKIFLLPESTPDCIGFNGSRCLRVHALLWGDNLLVYIKCPFAKACCIIDSWLTFLFSSPLTILRFLMLLNGFSMERG